MFRVMLVLTLAACAGCAATETPPDRTLRGIVFYDDEPPLEGSLVLLGSNGTVTTMTLAADGRFEILNPPTGRVRVGLFNYPRGSRLHEGPARPPTADPALASCTVPPRPQVRFPERFAEASTSPLEIAIAPDQSEIEIRFERRESDPPVVRKPDFHPTGIRVGDRAPEIAGLDLDDRPFSLSEYRGKVVALMYWGHWCKLCRDRFASERALVERMKGKPFAMLGVNSDRDRDLVRRENAKWNITWRTWWDGPMPGLVAQAWDVEGLPYVVLIDHTGVVRHRVVDAAELDRAVESLVAAVPARP